MKNNKKRLLTSVIAVLCIVSMAFTAMADYNNNITGTATRIGSITTAETGFSAVEGLSVTASGNNKRLFTVKVNNTDNQAALYMFEDYTTMHNNPNAYGYFYLTNFVGHANGMAIDDNYIYITGWNKVEGNNKNKIVRISRSMLWNKYQSTTSKNKGTISSTSNGVTILTAERKNGSAYEKAIKTITYYKDGKFIINYPEKTNSNYYGFTTATVGIDNDFIVNDTNTEIFQVKATSNTSKEQDIGYDPDCGFFISRWYEDTTNNAIIWVKLNSLSGVNRKYAPETNGAKYRIIDVNENTTNYTEFEIESVSIGSNNCMYASVNTQATEGTTFAKDAIVKIERATAVGGSKNFLGTYFAQ